MVVVGGGTREVVAGEVRVVVGGEGSVVDGASLKTTLVFGEVLGGAAVVTGPAWAPARVVEVVEPALAAPAVVVVVVDVEVDVGGVNRLVAVKCGCDSVASPVAPWPARSRDVAATTSTTIAAPAPSQSRTFPRAALSLAYHHDRNQSTAPGRPKAGFFPIDRQKASRPVEPARC